MMQRFTDFTLFESSFMATPLISRSPATGADQGCRPVQPASRFKPTEGQRHQYAAPLTCSTVNRRTALATCGVIIPAAAASLTPCAVGALPLAPLGKQKQVGDKAQQPSIEFVKDTLAQDLSERQYFVTGDLSTSVFADDCRFKDPTNDVTGLSRYLAALKLLFDPDNSQVVLKDIRVTSPNTIEATWTLGGYLRFPWHPKVETFEGRSVYTLNDQGLIQVQEQEWSKSAATALIESFTPTWGPR